MRDLFIPPEGITEENAARVKETLDRATAMIERIDRHAAAIGGLAMAWAGLDRRVDDLFVPLLNCSEAQVACILVENIATRCEMLKKLLHVERLPPKWTAWVEGLLNRVSGELASLRNRYIHDSWLLSAKETSRIDKRAKLGKAQSRQSRRVSYNTTHPTSIEDIERLSQCITTVHFALWAATHILQRWRSGGPRPRLSPQWLPACKPNSRCLDILVDPKEPDRPLHRLRFD